MQTSAGALLADSVASHKVILEQESPPFRLDWRRVLRGVSRLNARKRTAHLSYGGGDNYVGT